MKRTLVSLVLAALSAAACSEQASEPTGLDLEPSFTLTGNGMESGSHYNLNIIGVDKEMTASMKGNSGHRIFVRLFGGQQVCDPEETDTSADLYCDAGDLKGGRSIDGTWAGLDKINKILLTPNSATDGIEGFQVLDANATDQDGAEFTMPDNVYGGYTVYARALGKPGGSARMTTCADEILDEASGEIWCSLYTAVLERNRRKPTTEDVTDELLSLTIIIDPDADPALATCLGLTDTAGDDPEAQVTVPVFNSCFENYFWNYDNNGLRLLQLRFYPVTA